MAANESEVVASEEEREADDRDSPWKELFEQDLRLALEMMAQRYERPTGEPDALKGACPVREGAVGKGLRTLYLAGRLPHGFCPCPRPWKLTSGKNSKRKNWRIPCLSSLMPIVLAVRRVSRMVCKEKNCKEGSKRAWT